MLQHDTGLACIGCLHTCGHSVAVDFESSLKYEQSLCNFVDTHWVFSPNKKAPRGALAACPFKRTNAVYEFEVLLVNGLL